ncbi:DUF5518 domain-containing protein [Haloarchaeobius amylolyticus]|uniref:DUF5518 domain-containing protein n=1 Tax=Haloarchaeobius amylolyticus TaxID=1198296 RepID=UPI00226F3F1F|nr:DUF5518 domain-containing protein [Haloarchaeobius amylolyticus]
MALNFDERSSENGFWINAAIGGVAAIVLSFVPFSPVLGGLISGYLERDTRRNGSLKIGAASGAISLIPMLFVGVFFVGFGFLGALGGADAAMGVVFMLFLFAIIAVIGAIYTIGLGAAGGFLAHVLWEDDWERSRSGGRQAGYDEPAYETQQH